MTKKKDREVTKEVSLTEMRKELKALEKTKGVGGPKVVWSDKEITELEKIVDDILEGEYSKRTITKWFKQQRKLGVKIKNINADKTGAAFEKKLTEIYKQYKD